MRTTALAITALSTFAFIAPALAAPAAPSYSRCLALSEQRGSGVTAGGANHRRFMRDCLAGEVPEFAAAPRTQALVLQTQSYERCDALSVQRGAGPESGLGNHRRFMTACMAGKIR